MKNIAVVGCKVETSPGKGDCKIMTAASLTTTADSKAVYRGTITVAVSNYSDDNIANGAGTGSIAGTSKYSKADNNPVLLEEDSGNATLSGVHPKTGNPVTGYTVSVKITDANQDKAKTD